MLYNILFYSKKYIKVKEELIMCLFSLSVFLHRLRMRSNVVIKQLSIGVSSSDQSYMPQYVVVLVGRQPADLHEIKETRIQAYDSFRFSSCLYFVIEWMVCCNYCVHTGTQQNFFFSYCTSFLQAKDSFRN